MRCVHAHDGVCPQTSVATPVSCVLALRHPRQAGLEPHLPFVKECWTHQRREGAFSPALTLKQPIPINPPSPKMSSSCMNYPHSLPSLISFPQWIKQMAQSRGSGLLTKCLIRRTTLMWSFSYRQDDWAVARQNHGSGLLPLA